jgi:hypothetical protein
MAKQAKTNQAETHTTVLVLMVLFVALVLIVALGGVDITERQPADQSAGDEAATTERASTSSQLTAEGLLGIPVDQTGPVENRMITRPDGAGEEQVISFRTALPASQLADQYESWLVDNGYTIEKQKRSSLAASIAATRADQALIVLISYFTSSDTSGVDIINYRR